MAKQIFVSCGQRTDPEKAFGGKILETINASGMIGFFAEHVHDAQDINTAVFQQLRDCDGFVGVLQNRGKVNFPGHKSANRASVWIQQEIAILFTVHF